jgi:hypothetical protein
MCTTDNPPKGAIMTLTTSTTFRTLVAGLAAATISLGLALPASAAPNNDGRAPKPGGSCTGSDGKPIEAGGQTVEQGSTGIRTAQYCRMNGQLCTYVKIPSAGGPVTDKTCTGRAQG